MSFRSRNARPDDLKDLHALASQFSLLNLPADRKVLSDKIEKSVASFAGDLERADAEYLFVLEDVESEMVVGSSLIIAKHGTEESPHYFFRVTKQNRFSEDLGVGFIHQVLQLKEDCDGPTEIGGLLIDRTYRRRPEKLGKQVSLIRFAYMAMRPERFEKRVLCELTPPLGEGGRSEFWESLGRRFTGLPYQEADMISQRNKEFIGSLFPQEDIYLALLDSKARLVMGRVGQETRAAQHLLETIGFTYLHEVDPFDGGPHYGAELASISVVKNGSRMAIADCDKPTFANRALIAIERDGDFRGAYAACDFQDGRLCLPKTAMSALEAEPGENAFVVAI